MFSQFPFFNSFLPITVHFFVVLLIVAIVTDTIHCWFLRFHVMVLMMPTANLVSRIPSQLLFNLGGIDGITLVMSQSVCDKCNQVVVYQSMLISPFSSNICFSAPCATTCFQPVCRVWFDCELYDIDILHLVMTTYVTRFHHLCPLLQTIMTSPFCGLQRKASRARYHPYRKRELFAF